MNARKLGSAIAVIVLLAGVGVASSQMGGDQQDGPAAIERIAARQRDRASMGSKWWPKTIAGVLPNVTYKDLGDIPLSTHVVVGEVTNIDREKAMYREPSPDDPTDKNRGEIVLTSFDDDRAFFRILVVTVEVEKVVAGPPVDVLKFEWRVPGPGLPDAAEDPALHEEALRGVGRALWTMSTHAWATAEDGRLAPTEEVGVGVIDEKGRVSFPFFTDSDKAKEFVGELDTVEEIAAEARKPKKQRSFSDSR